MVFKRRERWKIPIILALMTGLCLPQNVSAAEEAEIEVFDAEAETELDPEVNEDSLRYLLLVDSFETAERIPTKRLSTPAEVVVVTSDEINANHYQSIGLRSSKAEARRFTVPTRSAALSTSSPSTAIIMRQPST